MEDSVQSVLIRTGGAARAHHKKSDGKRYVSPPDFFGWGPIRTAPYYSVVLRMHHRYKYLAAPGDDCHFWRQIQVFYKKSFAHFHCADVQLY